MRKSIFSFDSMKVFGSTQMLQLDTANGKYELENQILPLICLNMIF
jgi:hypothetical protein